MATLAIAAWAGMGNLGDDWLFETARRVLAEHEIVLLREPVAVGVGGAETDSITWPRVSTSGGLAALRRFRRELSSVDGVVFAGGGWLAGDQGPRSPMRWLARLLAANVPVAASGIGVGPFPTSRSLWLGGQALRRFETHLSCRTQADCQWVYRASGRSPVLSTDPALAFPPTNHVSETRTGVIVSMPAPRKHWWTGSVDEYRRAVRELAAEVSNGETITFVHFQHGLGGDAAFWEGRKTIGPSSIEEAATAFSEARIVVAGRLHAALLTCITHTAVIPFSYHHKFSVLESLGLAPYPVDSLLTKDSQIFEPQYATRESVLLAQAKAHADLHDAVHALNVRSQ